jgi:hypothetical protein
MSGYDGYHDRITVATGGDTGESIPMLIKVIIHYHYLP